MQTAPSILVVDDDQDIRHVMAVALGVLGYAVEVAANGLVASRLLLDGYRPALVLLDLMMPGMDGESLLAIMRQNPDTADIPVVIMSGNRVTPEKAAELHVEGYLLKPFDFDELARILARALA
ncbi:response regulator [Paraliomyxa miuraensis]|uniref:response regulator n=1 Tax=Paraliomyxa miuraensis TaxID=376150 RepID=UPI002254197F|nr:response regulator [Paraliomyxa miuraensis]MCX4242850.1 response regulator [Paraliomyxa miuraensis]